MVKKFLLGLLFLYTLNSSTYAKVETKPVLVNKANLQKKRTKKKPAPKIMRKVSRIRKEILSPKGGAQKVSPSKRAAEQSRHQEQGKIAQQKLTAELKRQENERQRVILRQQEKERIQQELLAAHQRLEDTRRQQEQQKVQQKPLAAQQRREAKGREFVRNIPPNNLRSYQNKGVADLFMKGCYGQNTTATVIY